VAAVTVGSGGDSVLSERIEGDSILGSPSLADGVGALNQAVERRGFRDGRYQADDSNGGKGDESPAEWLPWDPFTQMVQVSQILDPGLTAANRREMQRDIVQRTILGGSERHRSSGGRSQAQREEDELARLMGKAGPSPSFAAQLGGMLGIDMDNNDPLKRKDSAGRVGPAGTATERDGGDGGARRSPSKHSR